MLQDCGTGVLQDIGTNQRRETEVYQRNYIRGIAVFVLVHYEFSLSLNVTDN